MKQFALRLGIDRSVFFTLLTRVWNIGAGLLTITLITIYLSPELQGYYYTFNSLIALQIFAELGLNFAIIQFASHEMANLSWTTNGKVIGTVQAKRRLQSLLHFAFFWFGVAALLMIVVLLPVGLYFFGVIKLDVITLPNNLIPWTLKLVAITHQNVAIPWTLLVIFTAVNLFITPAAAILEGCGKVAKMAIMRLWQSIFAVTFMCVTLGLGGQLYALVASSLMTTIIGLLWLWINHQKFFKDILAHRTPLPGMDWRREIWPFQWRIAVSWMSGYLIFQLFNPLLFKTHGPIVAGQMGMSLQIISAINGSAMAWISTKVPTYGQLVASNQRDVLNALFARGLMQSFGFLLAVVSMLWLVLFYLTETGSPYVLRLLPLKLFTYLCLVCLANHIVFAEAAFLRAHKEEPFMWLSVLSGLTTATLALLFVPKYGATGAVYSYTATALIIGLIGGTLIFIKKRKQWSLSRY